MARPKSTAPTKGRLNLTISEQTRQELTFIATTREKSISELVAEWAAKEAVRIAKKQGKQVPDSEQMSLL